MKQLEYLHKHKGNESTTYNKGVQNIPEISTITAWMQDNSQIKYLENHFNSENASEDVVKVGEENIPLTGLLHWVLGGQSDGAQDDDYHDEGVKEWIGYNCVNSEAKSVIRD